ncbi:uncharacterized protein LOC111619544 [Centruroides sculpturatus]|uniref:uncharacterized protein LOC111619544 n=1 Tax=Centruroides sculpturatus TaxID=218467 RepID=UPI000C6CE079|nr:uncharacterized protein LOC111619544 [Centruroides sculpturatus]
MSYSDINSDDFWSGCTTRKFYQLLELEYSEMGLDPRIDNAFKFAVKLGLQHTEDVCIFCSKPCKIFYRSDRNSCLLRCSNCGKKFSAYDGTFKGKCGNISWAGILTFIWHYLGLECTSANSAFAAGISTKAAVDWSNHLRLVMLIALHNMTSFKIGGPNKTVEIDETLICKRKYEKGCKLKSAKWVVGGICRQDDSCFICQVNDRSENTLNWVISKFVKSGSLVLTDEWKGYNHINDLDGLEIEHRTVNRSEDFVNPEMGDNMQKIERLLGCLKNEKNLPKHYTEDLLDSYIYSFMYKRFMNWSAKKPGERFQIFVKHLCMIYPGSGRIPKWKEPETVPIAPVSNIKKKEKNTKEIKSDSSTEKVNKTRKKRSLPKGESSSVGTKLQKMGKKDQ